LLEMKPGQRAMYDQGKVRISEGDVTRFSAWREGKLIFKNTPMQEAIPKLERWFNVDIELKDPELLKYRFTAIFKNETIQQALEMLRFSSPINYKIVPGEKQPDESYAKNKIEISKQN
jgi:transmembrane sensor